MLFFVLIRLRRGLYRLGVFRTIPNDVPLIVVGNITVGGTGKTPITIWLCHELRKRGFSPGIISRGYGGKVGRRPAVVVAGSEAAVVGDEAVLMARRSGCPVVVHPNRVAAARTIVGLGANVVISDDGLQHYRLGRDYEIVVVDGARGYGNGHLLPAGPLRETLSRLNSVDMTLEQIGATQRVSKIFRRHDDREPMLFRLRPTGFRNLDNSDSRPLGHFYGRSVHAVAAIGNPARFFETLEAFGIRVIEHAFRDHATLTLADITFDDDLPVVMTEKDAVKCHDLGAKDCWYVPVDVDFEDAGEDEWVDALARQIRSAAQGVAG
jgi:tetraacyldisaccharide 4'-kinase